MTSPQLPRLRPAVRAIVMAPDHRVLLCRFAFDRPGGEHIVWATPGGGIEPGEPPLVALRRELAEEIGFDLVGEPPHVWHQEVVADGHATGYDGVINDYYLVRTDDFEPRGSLTDAELAAENVTGFRWWTPEEISEYAGPAVFAPRALATTLANLILHGPPPEPTRLGV